MLFLDPRISGDSQHSCVGCHGSTEGGSRGVYAKGEPVAPGAADGRVAPSLRGVFATGPYLWDGSIGSLEDVVDRMLAVEMRGGTLSEIDRRALIAYLNSLAPSDKGRVEPSGVPVEPATKSMRDGYVLFQEHCESCHKPPMFRRGFPSTGNVGTGSSYNIPSLRGLSENGPYGHDGRWATLEDAVSAILESRGVELSFKERLNLIEYLKLL